MRALWISCLSWLLCCGLQAAPGRIVLFNGTSSAGKSSLAEVVLQESKTKFEVVSFDDFHRAYRNERGLTGFNRDQHEDFLVSFYRHARAQSDAGRNIIIDTVEFDRDYDKYCAILDCPRVIKAIVYCPPEHLLKRIDHRNQADDPSGHRPLLLSFNQYLQMYKRQSAPAELVVERTHTRHLRAALQELSKRVGKSSQYESLHRGYVKAFGIDQDQDLVIVTQGKYDLVLDTKANTKKDNVRSLEEFLSRQRPPP